MSDRVRKIALEDLPRVGDIVSCNFPLAENPDQPGPKARPALVVSIIRGEDPSIPAIIEVAFGTSQEKRPRGAWLRIRRSDDLRVAGLHRPTLFMMEKAAKLPFTRAFFRCNVRGECRLGTVPAGLMRHVRDILTAPHSRFVATHARPTPIAA